MASSKMVNDRQRSAAMVAEAAHTHGAAVGSRLADVFTPLSQPGDVAVDWAQVMRQLERAMRVSMTTLVVADEAHEAEKADDPGVRRQRDVSLEAVYRELVDVRTVVESVYGAAGVEAVGLAGTTPRDPIALARLATTVREKLAGLARLPAVRRGLTLDVAAYDAPLAQALNDLNTALELTRREERELEATLVAKQRAMEAHDLRFAAVANALEGLFQLAGYTELAERVRPSLRRPGRTVGDVGGEEPETEPDGATGSDPVATSGAR